MKLEPINYEEADKTTQWFLCELLARCPTAAKATATAVEQGGWTVEMILNGVSCDYGIMIQMLEERWKIHEKEVARKAVELLSMEFAGLSDLLHDTERDIKRKLCDKFDLDLDY